VILQDQTSSTEFFQYPERNIQVKQCEVSFSDPDVFVVGVVFRTLDNMAKTYVYSSTSLLGSVESVVHRDRDRGLFGVLSDTPNSKNRLPKSIQLASRVDLQYQFWVRW
jgi:hypothetical protein